MIVESIHAVPGLYLVDQVYDTDLLDQFLAEDLSTVPAKSLPMQERWTLRKNYRIFPKSSHWHQLQQSVDYSPLNELGYYKYSPFDTTYWVDLPGFTTGIHSDNPGVVCSLQVYLDTADELGTKFYNKDLGLVFTVPYKKNSGYMLINNGQLHGFPNPVTQTRYSTYTWLKSKS